ncbi:protein-tyrosine phosphatase-like protein [Crepidotus variabilis]|uniref:protein-tyrosine-phosphatase n=1 Tax=Crepidotus variabilis TaxID=179855 RepID=A0A9P6E863_9AGAR|nr:protein-tyrosine phosphatase-like protein [Crepidotus variabilis]
MSCVAGTSRSSTLFAPPQSLGSSICTRASKSAFTQADTMSRRQSSWPPQASLPAITITSNSTLLSSHSARPPRNASEIIPRLYISDLAFAESSVHLSSHQITHILSVLPGAIFRPPTSILPNQPVRMQVRIDDLPFAELAAHLPKTTSFIRDALNSNSDARVLVHCAEGISRSVSVVAAYLMAQYGWKPEEAVAFIKSKRRIADPNFGFIQQLHEYARDVLGNLVPAIPSPLSSAI